ncbi:MAG: MobF family relaxase [Pirellula sp.]
MLTANLFSVSIHNSKGIGEIASYYCQGYYTEGGNILGSWIGSGAEFLDISGAVQQATLFHLLRGRDPNDLSKLVRTQENKSGQRELGDDRAGLDITMSAPKSVSLLWAYGSPHVKKEIELAFDRACKETFGLLEQHVLSVRTGKGGANWEHGKLIAAMFDHYTARNERDPLLHRHFVIPNVAFSHDGRALKINTRALLPFVRTLGPLFRNTLLTELRNSLGVEAYQPLKNGKPSGWFELKGVSEKLIDKLSSRRNEIVREIESSGSTTADFSAKQHANMSTRQPKDPSLNMDEIQKVWDEKATSLGITKEQFQQCLGREVSPIAEDEVQKAIQKATEELTEHDSHFDKWMLVRKTSEVLQDRPITASKIIKEIERHLKQTKELVQIKASRGTTIYTTQSMLDREAETRGLIEKLASRPGLEIAPKFIERAIQREKLISKEQADAVRRLAKSKGSLACLTGVAGAGKSTTLRTLVRAARRAGKNVIGISLSGVAAENLSRSAGIEACTIASFLRQTETSTVKKVTRSATHHLKMYLRAAMDKKTWRQKKLRLNSKSIIYLDEAGMVDTELGRRILIQAEKAGASVVATGDLEQLKPIGAGTPFKTMIERVGASELKTNHRQTKIEGNISQLVRDGDLETAFKSYAKKGDLRISKTRDRAISDLVNDWKQVALSSLKDVAILAQTNREVRHINQLCQAERLKAHGKSSRSISLPNCKLYTGERVRFGETSHVRGIKNGYFATVLSIDGAGNVTFKLDNEMSKQDRKRGRNGIVKLSTKELNALKVNLGYASSVHAYQGASIPFAYFLAGGTMQDQSLTYVALSRSTSRSRIYIDRHHAGPELCSIVKAAKRVRLKENAHDIQKQSNTHTLSLKD